MAQHTNTATLTVGYNITTPNPVDGRTIVEKKQDLIDASKWDKAIEFYNGLPVFVQSTKELYYLVNKEGNCLVNVGTATSQQISDAYACWQKYVGTEDLQEEIKKLGPVFRFMGVATSVSLDKKTITVGTGLTVTITQPGGATSIVTAVCLGFEYDLPHDKYYAWGTKDKDGNISVYFYTKESDLTVLYRKTPDKTDVIYMAFGDGVAYYDGIETNTVEGNGSISVTGTPAVITLTHASKTYAYEKVISDDSMGSTNYWWSFYNSTSKKRLYVKTTTNAAPTASIASTTCYSEMDNRYWWKWTTIDDDYSIYSVSLTQTSTGRPTVSNVGTTSPTYKKKYVSDNYIVSSTSVIQKFEAYKFETDIPYFTSVNGIWFKYESNMVPTGKTQRWWKFTNNNGDSVYTKTTGTADPTTQKASAVFYISPDDTKSATEYCVAYGGKLYQYDSTITKVANKEYYWKFVAANNDEIYGFRDKAGAPTKEEGGILFYDSDNKATYTYLGTFSVKYELGNICSYAKTANGQTKVIEASNENNGHVYQIEEDEYASNGLIWVQLGTPSDEWVVI